MDLSTNDVLFLLGAIEVLACVGCALYWLVGRGAEARPPRRKPPTRSVRSAPGRRASREGRGATEREERGATEREERGATEAAPRHPAVPAEAVGAVGHAVESDDLSDTGRHHVPDQLLHSPTYRLSADLRARAKVPATAEDLCHPIPAQVSRPVDQFSDA